MQKDIKCVVWDLDNTLWDGTLLEQDQLELKPEIRTVIHELDRRGILQSIASKNEVLALDKLKEFELYDYFLYPQVNWNPKSKSIETISKELNLSKDTFMFVDDQIYEREEVHSVYPEVDCVDAKDYQTLLENKRLNPRFITDESHLRRKIYQQEVVRKQAEQEFEGPSNAFLSSLGMKLSITKASLLDLKRAEELTLRTNQLNTTGITYSYEQLQELLEDPDYELVVCELTDKYGPYGKIGLCLIHKLEKVFNIDLLLMSCRVMSRGVGSVLITYLLKMAHDNQVKLRAWFKKTDRNRMMYITYRFANFKEVQTDEELTILENDLTNIPEYPSYINLNYVKI